MKELPSLQRKTAIAVTVTLLVCGVVGWLNHIDYAGFVGAVSFVLLLILTG